MEFKTVFDFLKSVPASMRHSEIYDNKVRRKLDGEVVQEVDLVEFERKTVGIGEMNILLDSPMPEKFLLSGMDSGFEISSGTLAKQKEKAAGKGSLNHTKDYKENYLLEKTVELVPSHSIIWNSSSSSLVDNSTNLYRTLMPHLSGISSGQATSGAIRVVGNKLEVTQDLRKIFLKGYLNLMSYNLSVCSVKNQLKTKGIVVESNFNVQPSARLAYLMGRKVVVDVENLSNEEVFLLAEIAGEYPSRRYGTNKVYTKTVYNNLKISADDLVLLGNDGNYSFENPPEGYGSPERMWHDLVGLACKLGALGDLQSVIADMRGLPFILKEVSESTGLKAFNLKYPDSYSIKSGVSQLGKNNYHIKRDSNYYATTKCLIADLLLGHSMVLGAFNVIEELGSLSIMGCPSGDAMNDSFLNSTLRDRGLKSDDCHENALLHEWRGIRERECVVSFSGKLKDYCLRIVERIRNGDTGFLRPMLLHSLPYSNCRDTTWATVRGWNSSVFSFDKKITERIKINLLTKAFTWTMGVSEDVPSVGLNAIGHTKARGLSLEECKLIHLAEGNYEISVVRHMINGTLGPRLDEMEMGPTAFYNTNFPGVKCTIVFDKTNLGKIVGKGGMTTQKVLESIGAKVPHEQAIVSFGGSKTTLNQPKKLPGKIQMINGKAVTVMEGGENEEGGSEPSDDYHTSSEKTAPAEVESGLPVVVVEEAPLNEIILNNNQPESRLKEKEVELIDGKKIKMRKKLNNDYVNPNIPMRGYLVKTKGDGKCGTHAVMNDFYVRNAISKEDKYDAAMEMAHELISQNNHSDEEIGAWLTNHNLGFYLLVDDGQSYVHGYIPRTGSAIHNVFIRLKDGHYSTFIPDEKGDFYFTPNNAMMVRDPGRIAQTLKDRSLDRIIGGPLWESLANITRSLNQSGDTVSSGNGVTWGGL